MATLQERVNELIKTIEASNRPLSEIKWRVNDLRSAGANGSITEKMIGYIEEAERLHAAKTINYIAPKIEQISPACYHITRGELLLAKIILEIDGCRVTKNSSPSLILRASLGDYHEGQGGWRVYPISMVTSPDNTDLLPSQKSGLPWNVVKPSRILSPTAKKAYFHFFTTEYDYRELNLSSGEFVDLGMHLD